MCHKIRCDGESWKFLGTNKAWVQCSKLFCQERKKRGRANADSAVRQKQQGWVAEEPGWNWNGANMEARAPGKAREGPWFGLRGTLALHPPTAHHVRCQSFINSRSSTSGAAARIPDSRATSTCNKTSHSPWPCLWRSRRTSWRSPRCSGSTTPATSSSPRRRRRPRSGTSGGCRTSLVSSVGLHHLFGCSRSRSPVNDEDDWQLLRPCASICFRWRGGSRRRYRRRGEPDVLVVVLVRRRAEPQERPPPPAGAGVHADHLRAHTPVQRFLGKQAGRIELFLIRGRLYWIRTDDHPVPVPACCLLSSDRHLLLPGRRDAAAARPPGDGGAQQAPVRLRARALLRLGLRSAFAAVAVHEEEEMWPGQSGGRRRGAPRALPGVRALPAQRRQPARLHRRHALRHPRRPHAALLGGPRTPLHLLHRRPRPVSPGFRGLGRDGPARGFHRRRCAVSWPWAHGRYGWRRRRRLRQLRRRVVSLALAVCFSFLISFFFTSRSIERAIDDADTTS